jgi:hypothetical protein
MFNLNARLWLLLRWQPGDLHKFNASIPAPPRFSRVVPDRMRISQAFRIQPSAPDPICRQPRHHGGGAEKR